jgi:hypothetical protein
VSDGCDLTQTFSDAVLAIVLTIRSNFSISHHPKGHPAEQPFTQLAASAVHPSAKSAWRGAVE